MMQIMMHACSAVSYSRSTFELLPAEVTAVSVVVVSSSRTVGCAGCNRKSFLMSGSAAATPGATYTASADSLVILKDNKK